MNGKDVVSLRLAEHEKEYLLNIGKNLELQKRESEEISFSKTLKTLLDFCIRNDISPTRKNENPIKEMRKMIEQIHASIPHLMYHNNYQSLVLSSQVNDDSLNQIKQKSIEYLNGNFSGFQNVTYKEVKFKLNGIGLKTVPIEQGESLWK
ncbi:MAG: hypothetical protein J0I93_10695 [Legionella sp.]|nr:hypothetical protein [Legionella sp.]